MSVTPFLSVIATAQGPALRLALFGLLLLPFALWLAWDFAPRGSALTAVVFLAGLGVAVRGMAQTYPHGATGMCNLVTLTRLALVSALAAVLLAAAPLVGTGAGWAVFAIAATALSLDGIDGWWARRQNLVSDFGARFDMEVDALLAATLAVLLMAQDRAGIVSLLILGTLRYVFVLATWPLPWLGGPLYPSLRRKTVCVIQIAVLAALTLPVLPDPEARLLAAGAAGLLVWSFARDIRWLARQA